MAFLSPTCEADWDVLGILTFGTAFGNGGIDLQGCFMSVGVCMLLLYDLV
jgi:hypothetical protein